MQTRQRERRFHRPPSRTTGPASPAMPRRGRAVPPRAATPQGRPHAGRSLRTRLRQAPGRRSGRREQAAPPFGLTFRAMTGTRHRPAPRGGRPIAFVSLLALLALACFPVLAHAESSAGIQYEPAPPSATGHGGETPSHPGPPANSSRSHSGGNQAPSGQTHSGSSEANPPQESESSTPAGGTGSGSGGGNGGKGQGTPGKTSSHAEAPPAKPLESSSATQGGGGGSSPVVPILIAIVVLAAISLGVVMWQRRRRGAGGAPVSPKAG